MPTHVHIGYSAAALEIDVTTGTIRLRPDFDPALHRVRIAIKDDDPWLDGDRTADEIGDDATQTAVVRALDGTLLARGRLYDEMSFMASDGSTSITGEMLEIDGELAGFLTTVPLGSGRIYKLRSWRNIGEAGGGPDDADPWASAEPALAPREYAAYDRVPCYVEGTLIRTDWGLRPIEMIGPGDLVETLGAGLQPVLWAGAVAVTLDRLRADPASRPVRIAAGAFGPDLPTRDLCVSRQHRIAIGSAAVQLWFGAETVFAPAHALVNGRTVRAGMPDADIVYHHLLLGTHQALEAEGLWAESLFPGDDALLSLSSDQRQEVAALLGPQMARMTTAYPFLRAEEARVLAPPVPERRRASRAA